MRGVLGVVSGAKKVVLLASGVTILKMDLPFVLIEDKGTTKWQLMNSDEVSPVRSGWFQG